MSRPLVVVGSLNLDTVLRVRSLPATGQTVLAVDRQQTAGGKGANQAVAAARAGAVVSMAGLVGDDPAGGQLRRALQGEGVAVDGIGTARGTATGSAVVLVSEEGENSIVVHGGANALVSAAQTARAVAAHDRPVVLVQLEVPLAAVTAAARTCRKQGGTLVLTPGPVPPGGLPEELLSLTDVLVPNEGETCALVGAGDAAQGAASLAASWPHLALVVTMGGRGVLLVEGSQKPLELPAPAVVAVDTTGAGDAFAGTLGAALAVGAPLREAAAQAVRTAAVSVTRHGPQTAPRAGEVEALLRQVAR